MTRTCYMPYYILATSQSTYGTRVHHANTSLRPFTLGELRDRGTHGSEGGFGLRTILHPPIALAALGDIGPLVSGPTSTGGVGRKTGQGKVRPRVSAEPYRTVPILGEHRRVSRLKRSAADGPEGAVVSRGLRCRLNVAPLLSHHAGLITAGLLLARVLGHALGAGEPRVGVAIERRPVARHRRWREGRRRRPRGVEREVVVDSSLATLGLSVEWEVSLATLRGPRGESPGSSFETSSGGGAGRVIRCGNGLALTDAARSDRQRDGDLSGKSRGHGAGTRGRGRGPSRSSVEDEALSRAGLNGDARRGDHGEHQRGACPERHPIDANLDSDDINHRHPNADCPTERPCPPTLAHPPLHLPNPHFLRLRWCGYVA